MIAEKIVQKCWEWKNRNCRETSTNWGSCITEVQKKFDPKTAEAREAYCAKFAWVVLDEVCRSSGIKNLLPKTAGAKAMLDQSRKVLRVDTKPSIGSVFYRATSCKKCTGHIGIVVGMGAAALMTIEGNNDDRIDAFQYGWSDVENAKNKFAFIHTEEIGGNVKIETNNSVAVQAGFDGVLLLGLAAGGLWWATSKGA